MITETLLTLVVTILSVDQDVAIIDKGRLAGLQAGDAGRIYYQLTVGATTKRIDVGEGTILAVEDSNSRLRIDGDAKVQPGYFVELDVPLVGSGPAVDGIDPSVRALIARLVPGNRQLQAEVERLIRERRSLPERRADSGREKEAELRSQLAELQGALKTGAQKADLRVQRAEVERLKIQADASQAREEVSRLARRLEVAESEQRQLRNELDAALSEAKRQKRAEHRPEVSAPLPETASPDHPPLEPKTLDPEVVNPAPEHSEAMDPETADPKTIDPKAMVPETADPGMLSEDAEVLSRIRAWARAWSEQRVDDYLRFYAFNFRPPEGQDRKQWEAERRPRILRPSFIDVQLEDLDIVFLGATEVTVKFRQLYRSDVVAVAATKVLKLAREHGDWKILEESIQD